MTLEEIRVGDVYRTTRPSVYQNSIVMVCELEGTSDPEKRQITSIMLYRHSTSTVNTGYKTGWEGERLRSAIESGELVYCFNMEDTLKEAYDSHS